MTRSTVPTDELHLSELLSPLRTRWRMLVLVPVVTAFVVYCATFLMSPVFTARVTLLPPQQQQSAAAAALQSLGALSAIAGGGGGATVRAPADQYVALLQSHAVLDRLIDQFDLMKVYERRYRADTRKDLADNVQINVGKKDGIITVLVDDTDPTRAASLANAHVDALRWLTSRLSLSEAQHRRVFFESQLRSTRDKLEDAQRALEASGFSEGALKAEPRAAAENYARLRAQQTNAEIRLRTLRQVLASTAPEVEQEEARLSALREQIVRAERSQASGEGTDFIGRYREYKYQETLLDLFARQYELARVDEAREGAIIQVVDTASPPEKKSKPARMLTALAAAIGVLLVLCAWFVLRRQRAN
jgi:uncharacterized protein involved in exopolysaccharide biosynthesis